VFRISSFASRPDRLFLPDALHEQRFTFSPSAIRSYLSPHSHQHSHQIDVAGQKWPQGMGRASMASYKPLMNMQETEGLPR
jgi:hypothetical protein